VTRDNNNEAGPESRQSITASTAAAGLGIWVPQMAKRSEAAKDLHKTVNLAGRCGLAGFKIALNA
jgi:hypothetical protein